MQKVKLPIKIDPIRSAVKRLDFEGIFEAKQMLRLAESSLSLEDDIAVTLSCYTDVQGLVVLKGHAEVPLKLSCQRCNQEMDYLCSAEFLYTPLLKHTEEDELPSEYELLELDEEGEVDLCELIEDELILSLPIVAMHPEDECPMADVSMTWGEIDPAAERPNPFAVLTSLKRK